MKQRHSMFRRENGIYYSLDTLTRKRQSLNTTNPEEAQRFLNALNEACKQPAINLQIAQVYLQHSDPEFAKRTWQHVMDEAGKNKQGETKIRWDRAMADKAFDRIRHLKLIQICPAKARCSPTFPLCGLVTEQRNSNSVAEDLGLKAFPFTATATPGQNGQRLLVIPNVLRWKT